MGLLFTPARNKYIVMGEKRGFAIGYARGFANGYARGFANGYARAIARGEARGHARVATRFAAWFARKEQAESAGRPFTEPPPFISANASADKHKRNPQR